MGPPSRGGLTCKLYVKPRASSRQHVWPQEARLTTFSRVAEPEPKLLAGAGAGILKFRLRLPAPAPGQTKVVYLIIIHIEQDQKSIFFPKNHEKSTFSLKSCENRHPQSSSRSRLRSRSRNFLKVGAGAEKNSFGSATLIRITMVKTGLGFQPVLCLRRFSGQPLRQVTTSQEITEVGKVT